MKRLVVAVLVITYAWWVTDVAPFSALSYVLVALPAVAVVALYGAGGAFSPQRADLVDYYQTKARRISIARAAPWFVVMLGAVALETVGLALGGHSSSVPTLSTTVDHLLAWHWDRALLFVVWLVVGAGPLSRLRQRQSRAGT